MNWSGKRMGNGIGNRYVTACYAFGVKCPTLSTFADGLRNKRNELVTTFCYALKAVTSNG